MALKVALIGGGGVRTPLVVYGLAESGAALDIDELALYDIDLERTEILAGIGREIVRNLGARLRITTCANLEETVAGAQFVLNSIRVGGIAARARDEQIAIAHGLAGQETTGPGGVAMALRTIPVTLAHARAVERVAPDAWFINFTNPAGLITQALTHHTGLRVIGICDTPAELFHQIAAALCEPLSDIEFDYAGLNHLGWIRAVRVRGQDVTPRLLADEPALRRLYPAPLFDPALIQTLGLIPSEYLFFYYSQRRAYENQVRAGATRGAEVEKLSADLFGKLRLQKPAEALTTYRDYLMRRSASYMKLEAEAGSAFAPVENAPDPFQIATGYHRIALDVITGLLSDEPKTVVINVPNRGAIDDLSPGDVVEVPCRIDRHGPVPLRTGALPESVRGLVLAVKAYERTAIRAAIEKSARLAELAMLEYPIIGQWELAQSLTAALTRGDPAGLGYLA
jgi:6-phospho-beta-glucosidase